MATTKSLPSHSGPPPSSSKAVAGGPLPSPTLYLTNLPEKINKPDLRTSLYMLFSTYGVVLDVNAMRGNKMRGQAHVVMRDVSASTQALRALQGFDFYGKEMKIQYSDNKKGRSHIFNRLEGEWKESKETPEETKKQSAFEAPRPGQRDDDKEKAGPGLQVRSEGVSDDVESHGTKRPREEEEDDEQEAPMDEDDDDDVEMEESDED